MMDDGADPLFERGIVTGLPDSFASEDHEGLFSCVSSGCVVEVCGLHPEADAGLFA